MSLDGKVEVLRQVPVAKAGPATSAYCPLRAPPRIASTERRGNAGCVVSTAR
jgi:hypothetical protein